MGKWMFLAKELEREPYGGNDRAETAACPIVPVAEKDSAPVRERSRGLPIEKVSEKAWLTAWQDLAIITDGISRSDARFAQVISALSECDDAYLTGNWATFEKALKKVRQTMEGRPCR